MENNSKKMNLLFFSKAFISLIIYPSCIYIYSHPQTDCFVVSQLFSGARNIGRLKLGSKPTQLYVRRTIILLSQQANYSSSGIIRRYVVAFVCLHTSAQFIRRKLHYANGTCKFLRQRAQPPLGHVYIVIHRQTILLYHNSSVWLDMKEDCMSVCTRVCVWFGRLVGWLNFMAYQPLQVI